MSDTTMNARQLAIFHQQLLLMRTTQEVIDLANGVLKLPPNDPRDALLEQLDQAFMMAEEPCDQISGND